MVMQHASGKREMSHLAIKHIVQLHHVFIQRSRHNDNLECRTRLHDIGDGAVARLGRDGVWLAGVVSRQRGHRQNFAGGGAHDDAGDTLGRMFLHRIRERRFHDVLHGTVHGEHHVQAIARLHVLVATGRALAQGVVHFRHAPAVHAG